jgi:hypothetical protein
MPRETKSPTIDPDALKLLYFERGIQYYISARYAAMASFLPVSGNLFHHALEMLLKGHLCKTLELKKLITLGHNLRKIWKRYKADISDSSLDEFDATISALHKFESLRYPENEPKRGMVTMISFKALLPSPALSVPDSNPPLFKIIVEELDALIKLIFKQSKMNPTFFTNGLTKDAVEYLKRCNEFGIV